MTPSPATEHSARRGSLAVAPPPAATYSFGAKAPDDDEQPDEPWWVEIKNELAPFIGSSFELHGDAAVFRGRQRRIINGVVTLGPLREYVWPSRRIHVARRPASGADR
jgi:hypothetical protein